MANISQIEVNGTTYDICDATARDEKVSKTGDTITGTINLNSTGTAANIRFKDTDTSYSIGSSTPSSNTYSASISAIDKDNRQIFYSQNCLTSDGKTYRSFINQRYSQDGATSYINGFYLGLNTDGTPYISMTTGAPAAWRTTLGLQDAFTEASISGKTITLTRASGSNPKTLTTQDTTYSAATTSAAGLMSAADKTKLNGIATGAQVNPARSETSTISEVITPASGITIHSAYSSIWGKLRMIHFVWSRSTAVSVSSTGGITDFNIGTIVGANPVCKATSLNSLCVYEISDGGVVQLATADSRGSAYTIEKNTQLNAYLIFMTE